MVTVFSVEHINWSEMPTNCLVVTRSIGNNILSMENEM